MRCDSTVLHHEGVCVTLHTPGRDEHSAAFLAHGRRRQRSIEAVCNRYQVSQPPRAASCSAFISRYSGPSTVRARGTVASQAAKKGTVNRRCYFQTRLGSHGWVRAVTEVMRIRCGAITSFINKTGGRHTVYSTLSPRAQQSSP